MDNRLGSLLGKSSRVTYLRLGIECYRPSDFDQVESTHTLLVSRNITCQQIVFNNNVAIDVNTNVVKDVILFRYENPKFFRILSIFSLCQFVFWMYLAHFSYTSLRDSPTTTESDTVWWRRINLGENKYKNTLATLCLVIAYGILASSWLFTLKSIRYLVLHKGGKIVTFVSYTPFGKNRLTTVNLNKVSCEESRHSAKVQLPIKVEGHRLFYILDMRGEFLNPRLFDHTVGLKRILNRHFDS
uniref:Transmembrane protein 223 n=1 Tax=Timema poppense TaxID=170557 RepID=A0A7R9GXH8_TIMPO|nr:unnamed protein product [Timema poppensis]